MRIDKFLADNLCISREQAKEMIKRREVFRGGVSVRLFDEKINEGDIIRVGEREIVFQKNIYILLNKPAGLLCENRKTPEGTVFSCIPETLMRKNLSTAGRLDKDTEGLLIITDDGDFIHRIISPKNHVPKEYFARLAKPAEKTYESALAAGITIDGGEVCKPAEIRFTDKNDEVFLAVYEGKFHQVKRMFAALGNEVIFLRRTKCGELALPEKLPVGCAIVMTPTDCAKCSKAD
ncbi:MAG: rRNA pseudouridine synthase [Ruminococcus sp.]|jgi:16S rRNA pseudouridine516 synthase|nr:rRNA pseudouridine synthase [Ruminococcus sp.]